MPASNVVVPILGGSALLLGGLTAIAVDCMDLANDPKTPRPILIRYTSLATFDLKKRPHWIFVAACTVFAPCLIVTGIWQSQLAETETTNESLPDSLRLFATLCSVAAFLVAILPMGNAVGTVVHIATAAVFASMGINYAFRTRDLAAEMGREGLELFRLIVCMIGMLGGVGVVGFMYPAIQATENLKKHEQALADGEPANGTSLEVSEETPAPESKLMEPKQIRNARIFEAILAISQLGIAIAMSLALLSAAAEVGDVERSDEDKAALIDGLAVGVGALFLAGVFYYFNNFFYNMCQAPKHEEP